ncbi:MAG: hypothetical protein K2Q26_12540 [Bdellovibrionales bacterium]|nr:hypothetical protein [Bdellovibrionales bacterium]
MSKEQSDQTKEKDLVVKLGPSSRVLAESVLDKVNSGEQFKGKVTFKDIFDHLLKTYGAKAVPDLIKLREQPEDKLKLRYQQSGTNLEYHDWIEQQLTKLDEVGKKSSKKERKEDVNVN